MKTYRHHIMRALRLVLPLSALALMATVFLLARSIDPDVAITTIGRDIAALTREPRIGGARIALMTRDDSAVIIHAEVIRSDAVANTADPLRLYLDGPIGSISLRNDTQVQFKAQTGTVDQAADTLVMQGGVTIETSDGYSVHLPELRSRLSHVDIRGVDGVRGHGPAGELSAATLHLTQHATDTEGYVLAFKGNVRLLYIPED